MGSMSIMHWLIVLGIVVLVFGTGKLRNLGKDLGGAVKGFKDGLKEGETEGTADKVAAIEPARQVPGQTIDVAAKEKI